MLLFYGTQILALCNCGDDVCNLVHTVIDKYAERGLRSLAVARQVWFCSRWYLKKIFFHSQTPNALSCFLTASSGEEQREPRRSMGIRGSASSAGPSEVGQLRHNQARARPRCQRQDDHRYASHAERFLSLTLLCSDNGRNLLALQVTSSPLPRRPGDG
jgi:hypothetical protein